jgi:hypothetical protein
MAVLSSAAAAQAFVEADPFVRAGLVHEWTIREMGGHAGLSGLSPWPVSEFTQALSLPAAKLHNTPARPNSPCTSGRHRRCRRADGHRRKQHCRPWPSLIPARAPQRACQGVWTSGRVPHTAKPATSTRFATCTRSTGQSKDGSARLRIRRAIAGSVNHDQVDSRVRPSRWPSCEHVIHLGVAGRCWWGASLAAGPTVGAWTVACSRRSG